MARIFVPSWLRVSLIESANPTQLVSRHFRISKAGMGWAVGRKSKPKTVEMCQNIFHRDQEL